MAGIQRDSNTGNIAFNPYAAGSKTYGVKSSPTIGAVDKTGYAARDRMIKARKNALLTAMKNTQQGAFAAPSVQKMVK